MKIKTTSRQRLESAAMNLRKANALVEQAEELLRNPLALQHERIGIEEAIERIDSALGGKE